jgi:hypothetical protein
MTQEALMLALEALYLISINSTDDYRGQADKAITAIKEALREHAMREVQRLGQEIEQEPVKMVAYNCTCGRTMKFESVHGVVAPQRTWVGLTDKDISEIVRGTHNTGSFVRAIETKLKELNT